MQGPQIALLTLLVIAAAAYIAFWARTLTQRKQWTYPSIGQHITGFVTDFLDTLSIGSFAVTTAIYRMFGMVEDRLIPGTLNVGHALPTIAQALIFIAIVTVDGLTLITLIAASVVGATFGASIVSRLSKTWIQLGMGTALAVAAVLMVMGMREMFPSGGNALGLQGGWLVVGIAFNLLFGALMTIGVGAYAPIMVMVSLMGMDPKAAFPIMMGSCAFLMPAASWQFIRHDRYSVPAALGLTICGIPGVILAAKVFSKLNVNQLKWLVLCIVIYTSATMLWSAWRALSSKTTSEPSGDTPTT